VAKPALLVASREKDRRTRLLPRFKTSRHDTPRQMGHFMRPSGFFLLKPPIVQQNQILKMTNSSSSSKQSKPITNYSGDEEVAQQQHQQQQQQFSKLGIQ
jgi:hypothetical protein